MGKKTPEFVSASYLFIAIVSVAIVAYVVYYHCKPKVHEAFSDRITTFSTEFDRLNPEYSTQQCTGDRCQGRMIEPKQPQHIDEARVSFLEGVNEVAAVRYGQLTENDPQTLSMYALTCMWSNIDSHSGVADQSQIDVDLAVTVFVRYSIGSAAHMTTKSFDVKLSVDKTYRSFIPINTDVVNRKIAHSARIVRVCIERKDRTQAVLGVEKVCVVKYLASPGNTWNGSLSADDSASLQLYAYDAGKKRVVQDVNGAHLGNRIEMGVVLCDPVSLVSQNYRPTKDSPVVSLATTPALIADVDYHQTAEPTYGDAVPC